MAGANPTTPLASRCSLATSIACGLLFVCSAGARAQDAGVESERVDLALPQALTEEADPSPEQTDASAEQANPAPEASPEPAPSPTPTEDPDYSIEQLQDLSLEELLNVEVVTAAKQVESASSASAIISVITADEIALWGYRSVAEALSYVPGLYQLYDFVSSNTGVRGINGGLGAYGRSVKVMIDGQPVSFRSSAANYLGPEFIAMEAIDRIEVVRGPASALYGANAFLGVVNIIMRKPGAALAGTLGVRGGSMREHSLGGLASGRLEGGSRHVQALVSGSGGYLNRDGHRLPSSSPHYDDFAAAGNLRSRNDEQRPRNVYARVQSTLADHALSLTGHYMVLDSDAEFLDSGQLAHDNRVVKKSGTLWLQDVWQAHPNLTVFASVAYASGRPGEKEHLSAGAANSYKRRRFGFDAIDGALEAQLRFYEIHSLTAGVDHTYDHEELMRVYAVNETTGNEVLEAGSARTRNFNNTGAYGQYRVEPFRGITANAAARFDHHNIYGDQFTYRVGWVHSVVPRFTYKLLYGTSFRAPTAVQLFGQSLYAGDARGNPGLKPEKARTVELGLEWRVVEGLVLLATGCWIEVEDKVEVVPRGIIVQPRNLAEQRSLCAEGEVRFRYGWSTVLAAVSYARSTTRGLETSTLFTDEANERDADLYPELSATARWNISFDPFGTLGLSARYAAARRASVSNIADNRGDVYEIDPYVLFDAIYGISLGDHRVELAARNLLDTRFSEPGFLGVDVPGRGRELWLGYHYKFD
jgi:outer membrane receptor for ferrienterochelin and colicin